MHKVSEVCKLRHAASNNNEKSYTSTALKPSKLQHATCAMHV